MSVAFSSRRPASDHAARMQPPSTRVPAPISARRLSYVSPPGTAAQQWRECGEVTHDRAGIDEAMRYRATDPKKLQHEPREEIGRRVRKSGRY